MSFLESQVNNVIFYIGASYFKGHAFRLNITEGRIAIFFKQCQVWEDYNIPATHRQSLQTLWYTFNKTLLCLA